MTITPWLRWRSGTRLAFTAHDAEAVAKKARDRYKNALRKKNYGF